MTTKPLECSSQNHCHSLSTLEVHQCHYIYIEFVEETETGLSQKIDTRPPKRVKLNATFQCLV